VLTISAFVVLFCAAISPALPQAQAGGQQPQPQKPVFVEWAAEFSGNALDTAKWEQYSIGGGAGVVKVQDGELRMHGMADSRSGIRTKEEFYGDRFLVEAQLAKVEPGILQPGESGTPIGNAILNIMFDASGRNRIEWILTSEGTLEAWLIRDGRGERLDNHRLGTREKSPKLGVGRRGDLLLFMINDQVGLQYTAKNLPDHFHLMLYGYGASQNNWKSVRIVTPAKS
jgi:hypothetical protein